MALNIYVSEPRFVPGEGIISYLFPQSYLPLGCIEADVVLRGDKVGALHVFRENPLPYSGFVGYSLESILF
jgi:hypothetical protein